MAELLVRVTDKINEDFYLNCQCTKRGDVIAIQADGWGWGREELTNPDWRILRLVGQDPGLFSAYLEPELPPDPLNPPRTLQRRVYCLDLDSAALPQTLVDYLADVTRAQPWIDITVLPS